MRPYFAILMLFMTPLFSEDSAREVLLKFAQSVYRHEDTAMNRASCTIESLGIANAMDASSRKIVTTIDFEAIFFPNNRLEVKAKNIPARYGVEAVMGAKIFCEKVERWLGEILGHLDSLPKSIHPEQGLKGYNIQWKEGEEGKCIVLLKNTEAKVKQDSKESTPRERMGDGLPANKFREMMNNRKPEGRQPPGLRERLAPDKKEEEPKAELNGQRMEIYLNSMGQISEVLCPKGRDLEKTRLKIKLFGNKWLIEDLDISLFDDQNRLKERNLIRYNYTTKSGVLLPLKLTLKALDAKGNVLSRGDDPNPVIIDFKQYIVEVRK